MDFKQQYLFVTMNCEPMAKSMIPQNRSQISNSTMIYHLYAWHAVLKVLVLRNPTKKFTQKNHAFCSKHSSCGSRSDKVFYSRASLSLNQIAYVIIINCLYTVTVACAMRHAHHPHGIREISESNHTREEAIK